MKDEEIDYSYGPRLIFKLFVFVVCIIPAYLCIEYIVHKRSSEITIMENEASEYKRMSDTECGQAGRVAQEFIGKMYWADPIKFNQSEEEMIERAKAERPYLYSELVEKRATKEKICGDAAIMQAMMERNVEARKKRFL